ncbi:hypothetical protein F1737_09300 [Methanoplanus sp. FWC-SCC4]|uniref:Uncharacterized protein n=1 Tax=Methanochimaera problematica TaxID=2609417 RepID=A0AA97FDC2_9EURY|nr:hypothetical protein [Methanoplanus sp. FWC-SCC4]WOF16869.1 hypothetical protein F1737_09300 [Methanoplanus sp. FWC-SCC4]
MRILSFFSMMASLPAFLGLLHEKLYGESSTCETDDSILFLISKTERSFDEFLKSFLLIFGSSVISMVSEPPDAEKRADAIFEEFKQNYHNFVTDFRMLLDAINSRKGSLKESLGADWFRIETLNTAFSKPSVDWDYVCEKKSLLLDNAILKNERRFNSRITGRMKDFAESEFGMHDFMPLSIMSEIMENSGFLNSAADYVMNLISYGEDEKNR